jgi:hypothetical protein
VAVRARGRGGPRAGAGSGAHPARRFPQGGRGFGVVASELQPLQRRRRQHLKASRTAPHGLRGARGGMGTEAAHHRGARATSRLHPLRHQPAAIRAPRRPNLPEQMPGPARAGGAGRQFGVCRVVAGQPENASARQSGAAGGRAARCAARGCCGGVAVPAPAMQLRPYLAHRLINVGACELCIRCFAKAPRYRVGEWRTGCCDGDSPVGACPKHVLAAVHVQGAGGQGGQAGSRLLEIQTVAKDWHPSLSAKTLRPPKRRAGPRQPPPLDPAARIRSRS